MEIAAYWKIEAFTDPCSCYAGYFEPAVMISITERILYMGSSCTYHTYELIKFIKKSKKIYACIFHPTPSVYKILISNS
jgi:hypothetical protein